MSLYGNPHTRLMNKFIGLCSNTSDWPSVMYKMGYRIELIEQKISMETGSVTPDVVVMSNRLSHAVVVDCKSGNNIDHKQDYKYKSVTFKDLSAWVDIKERSRFKHTACYVVNDSNYDKLIAHTELPFVIFGEASFRGQGNFGHADLDRTLCRRTSLVRRREPTAFYPFSINDDEHLILRHVLYGLILWINKNQPQSYSDLTKNKTLIDLLKIIHPHYKRMSEKHRNDLRNKVKKVFNSFLDRKELKVMHAKMLEGEVTAPLWQKFQEQCKEAMAQREVQATLD